MPRRAAGLRFVLGALAAVFLAAVPPGAAAGRPRIGLALGGGAARGYAHIGVLRWFEEHRIPVDFVAGTSMGALVGGAYAMGYSPDEIVSLAASLDWDTALQPEVPYASLAFRRKQDRREYPFALTLGLRDRLRLPGGLSPVPSVGMLLSRISLPYGNLRTFDSLPVPFRCVAVDIESGEQVVLSDGPLWQALRASMAIPGVFTPVERAGRLLVDGGLLNNVPADVVRRMGADLVIAVDVSEELADRAALYSLLGLANQSVAVMMLNNTRRMLREADLVVAPVVRGIPGSDYARVREIAALGYAACEARARFLEGLALDEASWESYVRERQARKRTEVPVPASARLTGVSPDDASDGGAGLMKGLSDGALDPVRLEVGLQRLQGRGRYGIVGYHVEDGEEGSALVVTAFSPRHGPPFLNTSLKVRSTRLTDVQMLLGGRLTSFDRFRRGDEVRVDLGVGRSSLFKAEWFVPLQRGGLFAAPRLSYAKSVQDVYFSGVRVSEQQSREAGAGVDLGWHPGPDSEVRLGLFAGHLLSSPAAGTYRLARDEGAVQSVRLRVACDGQDGLVPTRGSRLEILGDWYLRTPGAPEPYLSGELRYSFYRPAGAREVIFFTASGGTCFGKTAPASRQFTLGGPLRLGAYGVNELRGSEYLFGSAGYLKRIGRLPQFAGGKVFMGASIEYGTAFERLRDAEFAACFSAGLVMETLAGPVFFGGSWGEGSRRTAYFAVGHPFP